MKKIIALSILLISSISSASFASNASMAKWLRHEISSDQLTDHYCPSSINRDSTIYHSDGSKGLIRSNGYETTIYHGNGSKSLIRY